MDLSTLKNTLRKTQKVQRVGRGIGSNRGKTSCRGQKGDKARSGYKRRHTKEGGNVPFFQKLPTRGFSNVRFKKNFLILNLSELEKHFDEKETVSVEILEKKGLVKPSFQKVRLKILGSGTLKKQLAIQAHRFTKSVEEKIKKSKSTLDKIE
jgi:large subunit ribosomal protein L15